MPGMSFFYSSSRLHVTWGELRRYGWSSAPETHCMIYAGHLLGFSVRQEGGCLQEWNHL